MGENPQRLRRSANRIATAINSSLRIYFEFLSLIQNNLDALCPEMLRSLGCVTQDHESALSHCTIMVANHACSPKGVDKVDF